MFLLTKAAFPYCNWSIKIALIIGSTRFDNSPAYVNNGQRLGCLPFFLQVYVKLQSSLKLKLIIFLRKEEDKININGASMVSISIGAKLSSILFLK